MTPGVKKRSKPKDPVREERIAEIMEIMRPVADAKGNPTWSRKVRLELGKKWNLPDYLVRPMSAEASKRLMREALEASGKENMGTLKRDLVLSAHNGMVKTFGRGDHKGWGIYAPIALKLVQGPDPSVSITVSTKAATPAEAAALVLEEFGPRVKNDSSTSGDVQGEESPDAAGESQDPET